MNRNDLILEFWFDELKPQDWFNGGNKVDNKIRKKFSEDLEKAVSGQYDNWAEIPNGRLALIILFDQFSRNMYRDQAAAFAQDRKAQGLVIKGLSLKQDESLPVTQRIFFYMPLMHAEDLTTQHRACDLYESLIAAAKSDAEKARAENSFAYAKKHREVIEQFGRFPFRNEALGRESTPEELEFMKDVNNKF